MNNSLYEEYMRSVLGYSPVDFRNTYDMNYTMNNIPTEELQNCYPDIYKIVYPMVQKACNQNTRPITKELVDSMTEEIYFSVEDNEITQTRNENVKMDKIPEVKQENRQRVIRNRGLNDLIKVLILRELLGRPNFPGVGPGFPGNRPPIGPRPPYPPMRPPVRPMPYNRDNDIFE